MTVGKTVQLDDIVNGHRGGIFNLCGPKIYYYNDVTSLYNMGDYQKLAEFHTVPVTKAIS